MMGIKEEEEDDDVEWGGCGCEAITGGWIFTALARLA